MGRKKVEIKKIENQSSRMVTFSKRRTGLIKKARELSILCEVDVGLLVYSNRGRKYEYCSSSSSSSSLPMLIEQYTNRVEETEMVENYASERSNGNTRAAFIQIVQSLDGPYMQQLSVDELVELEQRIDVALALTRSRKTQVMIDSISTLREQTQVMIDSISTLREQERILEEEKQGLHRQIATMGEEENNNVVSNEEKEEYQLPLQELHTTTTRTRTLDLLL